MVLELPLVSIVIPTYNAAQYLADAIDSVLAQDYPNVELIVVDDGSRDETPDVLATYSGRFVVHTQANSGQASALNRGWSMSNGSILGYLSADDLLKPQAVSRAVEAFETDRGVAATHSNCELISPDSRVIRRITTRQFDYLDLLYWNVFPPGPGSFFRRSAYELTGGWNPEYRQMPDLDFWLRIGLHGRLAHIDSNLASYRVHPDSLTFAKADANRADEPIQITQRLLQSGQLARFGADENLACAVASVVAARAHFRSRRYKDGLKRIQNAWRLCPPALFRKSSLRLIRSGLIGQPIHVLMWSVARARKRVL